MRLVLAPLRLVLSGAASFKVAAENERAVAVSEGNM